jgi:hypothetical protein
MNGESHNQEISRVEQFTIAEELAVMLRQLESASTNQQFSEPLRVQAAYKLNTLTRIAKDLTPEMLQIGLNHRTVTSIKKVLNAADETSNIDDIIKRIKVNIENALAGIR